MLNPSSELRLKVAQIQKHPWITNAFGEEFTPINEKWKTEMFQKYSKGSNLTMEEVADEISKRPYGQLGGIYNIEKHLHQMNKIALKRAPSCARIIKVINHINSIFHHKLALYLQTTLSDHSSVVNRPATSVANNFMPTINILRRPKTAQSKSDSLKPLDNKLTYVERNNDVIN